MTDKLPDVWATRDFPVLIEAARRLDAGETHVRADEVADTVGVTYDDVTRAATALERRGYVTLLAPGQGVIPFFTGISSEAYVVTGLHPSEGDAVSSLVDALRQAADLTDDDDERGKLRQAADKLGSVTTGVLGGVLTAWITSRVT